MPQVRDIRVEVLDAEFPGSSGACTIKINPQYIGSVPSAVLRGMVGQYGPGHLQRHPQRASFDYLWIPDATK